MSNCGLKSTGQYKYFAFISYSSKDTEWGKRLQKKLEHYRMPATLCHEHGWKRTPIKPVFFAPTDIQPGDLTAEIKSRLIDSCNLIVICSPNSAKSEWVGKEIAYFHSLGRTKNIHFFIVEGTPHSGDPATECFNPIVDTFGLPEILGANVNEKIFRWSGLNRERAYVQLISKLLNVEFDAIWQRHRRLIRQKIATWLVSVIIVTSMFIGVWCANQPFDVELSLVETSFNNPDLPQLTNAVVAIDLENDIRIDTIGNLSDIAIFRNLPHKFLNKLVNVTIKCRDYIDVDTAIYLNKYVVVSIKRDPMVYGNINFDLWNKNGKGLANVKVYIAGDTVVTDNTGHIQHFVPLAKQRTKYQIASPILLSKDYITMPCGDYDVVVAK